MSDVLFPALEQFILASAPAHVPVADAPETLEALQAWAAQAAPGEPMPVWNGASDRTIYSTPEINFAYRAWHDATHLAHGWSTSLEDELRVALQHVADAKLAGLPQREIDALWYDSQGQNEYFERYGEFMQDQRGFVLHCLDHGLDSALARRW